MANGRMATLTVYRNEQVSGWTLQETAGAFRSVAAVGDTTFVLVERSGGMFIEVFDKRLHVDAGNLMPRAQPIERPGLGSIILTVRRSRSSPMGSFIPKRLVAGGQVTLSREARRVAIGLGFAHVVEPLPAVIVRGRRQRRLAGGSRPVTLTFRFLDTAALYIDTGRGVTDYPFRRLGTDVARRFARSLQRRSLPPRLWLAR